MPVYEYDCQQCHTSFEVRASFQEKQAGLTPVCPHCGRADARQVFSGGLLLRTLDADRSSVCACGSKADSGCCP